MAYTTTELVQSELLANIAFSSSTIPTSSTVTTWISEVEAEINLYAGRSFEALAKTEYIDYNGDSFILLSSAPVNSISGATYFNQAYGSTNWESDVLSLTEGTHYALNKNQGIVEFLTNNFSPKEGLRRFYFSYTAGGTLPLYIQALATKKVALRVIDATIANDIKEKQSGKSISVGSISIVKPANYSIVSYTKLKNDIELLEKNLLVGTGVYRYGEY